MADKEEYKKKRQKVRQTNWNDSESINIPGCTTNTRVDLRKPHLNDWMFQKCYRNVTESRDSGECFVMPRIITKAN